jgi:hypothetical protein
LVTSRKDAEPSRPRRPPATTPEARESQMISLAVEVAEAQMRAGTASSQVITHYLKLATTRERLEQEKLTRENALLAAKADSMISGKNSEDLYEKAIKAMKSYQGQEVADDYED